MRSPEGKLLLQTQLLSTQEMMGPAVDYVFSQLEERFQDTIDEAISGMGVLSLTEVPLNQQMWAHYSSEGAGFVVGLDAQHAFFLSSTDATNNLLRKVIYTDERVQNFWSNPYYLFLVKSAGWAYEREWRMFKKLSECDERRGEGDGLIALQSLPPGIIKEVYFGYGFDPAASVVAMANLRSVRHEPSFFQVRVNRAIGELELDSLT